MTEVGQGTQSIPEELRAAIRKEAITQTAKYTVAAVVGLLGIALLGWWLYLQQKIDEYIKARVGVPAGIVAAFDLADGCPTGWGAFSDGADRVILGTGPTRPFRVPGGAPTLTLRDRNLPPHQHETVLGVANVLNAPWGAGPPRPAVAGASFGGTFPTALTSSVLFGSANPPEPINIMPPFIALTLCKKSA
jgi:hypothetical protein